MKSKKTMLALVLAMTMLLGLLGGCGKETAASTVSAGSVSESAEPTAAPATPSAEPETSAAGRPHYLLSSGGG